MSKSKALKFLKYGRHVKSQGKPATFREHLKAKRGIGGRSAQHKAIMSSLKGEK